MPIRLGDNGDLVARWQHTMLQRFRSYAKAADGGPLRVDGYYGYDDRDVQREYERRTEQLVDGVVSDDDLRALGITGPVPPRMVVLTFRGTGGVIGADYTSRAAAAAGITELPVPFPAAMGGIPVGAAADVRAPSGQKSADLAVEWACAEIERTTWSFALCGYSLGAYAASRVRAELLPGGRLDRHADRYICGVMIGNPARPFGHTYYLGAVPDGYGIADWHLPEAAIRRPDGSPRWDWCELVDPGDLYANAPGGRTGDILRTAYRIVMDTELSDPAGTAQRIIPQVLRLLDQAGIRLPLDPAAVITGAAAGLLSALLPGELTRLLSVGDIDTAAAVRAALLAARFYADRTAAHISYEFREVWPGQTYLGLAAQHLRDWSSRRAVA